VVGVRRSSSCSFGIDSISISIYIFDKYIADVPKVHIVDPKYPVYDTADCAGEWSYIQYKSCANPSKPIMITDANVCGSERKNVYKESGQYNSCRHPSHGIDRFLNAQVIEQWSGWMRGGYNQQAWCSQVRAVAEARAGRPVDWQVMSTDEESKREFPGQVFYRYFCRGEARWDPIYTEKSSPPCGLSPPQEVSVDVPRTCPDPNKGFSQVVNVSCGENLDRKYLPSKHYNDILDRYKRGEIASFMCTTCETFRDNIEQYAECMVASGHYALERSDSAHQSMARSRLIAIDARDQVLSRGTQKKVRDQIRHLDRALGDRGK
jgi:hypothetical protein